MRYKLLYAVFSLLLVFVACSSEDAVVNKENGKMSRVLLNIPTSEQLESVKSLFFNPTLTLQRKISLFSMFFVSETADNQFCVCR